MGNILSKITDVLGGNLLKGATDLIDQVTTTKEEKEAQKIQMAALVNEAISKAATAANQELEIITKDAQNARERDIQANNSNNSSWLAKNINPILALGCLLSTFAVYAYCFRATIQPANKDIVMIVIGSLNTIQASVVAYYFGASKQRPGK